MISEEIHNLFDIIIQNNLKFLTKTFRHNNFTIKLLVTRNETLKEKLPLFADVKYICPATFNTFYGKIINIGNNEEITVLWNEILSESNKENTSTFQLEFALKKLQILKIERE